MNTSASCATFLHRYLLGESKCLTASQGLKQVCLFKCKVLQETYLIQESKEECGRDQGGVVKLIIIILASSTLTGLKAKFDIKRLSLTSW